MIQGREPIPAETAAFPPRLRPALDAAAECAARVDREARFPFEAMEELRSAAALSWSVPSELGGAGCSIEAVAESCFELARRCAATGMIFAMHNIQVACIVRHFQGNPWFADYLGRLSGEQRLIASATSEIGVGGDIRRSIAAIARSSNGNGNDRLQFEKKASTISYGAEADDLLTTVRRGPDSDGADQVLVLTHASETEMEQISNWDTLGMRGTCSPGFHIRAAFRPEQVLPVPFAAICGETMVPVSHILWAHVWLGIATDAFHRAQNFVREQARQNPANTGPAGLRLSELAAHMAQFRAMVKSSLAEYSAIAGESGRQKLSTLGYAVRINNLKIAASECAVEACQRALRVCGVLGYKNDGPFSIGRHLRDSHSAELMISNDRLIATNAALLLVHRETS